MIGYKNLKSKSKVIVRKKIVIDQAEVTEIVDEKQNIIRPHKPEQSHEELQIVAKKFDPSTGEALSDSVQRVDIKNIENQLNEKKKMKEKIDSEVADFEQLLSDLNQINNKAGEKNG
jgi:hypothetical protein|tara:strand:- start:2107 stop:2457 length:351 start_codon:yes stop_codon:yes gene_type:complete